MKYTHLHNIANKTIMLCLSIILVSCNQDKKESDLYFNKSKKEFKSKEYLKASKHIDISIKLDSSNNDKILLKAKILNGLELYEQSNIVLNYLLENNYKKDTVYYELSQNHFEEGCHYFSEVSNENKMGNSYLTALKYINKAVKLNPSYIEAYALKVKILSNNNNYEEAISCINQVIKLFPNNKLLIGMRGHVKHQLGDIYGALIDLTDAVNSNQLDKEDKATFLRFRGLIFYEQTNYTIALKDIIKSILYNSKDDYSFEVLGEIYSAMGDYKNACLSYRRSANLGNTLVYEKIKELCGSN